MSSWDVRNTDRVPYRLYLPETSPFAVIMPENVLWRVQKV